MTDKFLSNPDKIHIQISCLDCKKPLWEQKILSRMGHHVGSTQTLPIGQNSTRFGADIEKCPLCGKTFYGVSSRGSQMYLIRDMNSGIQRLI